MALALPVGLLAGDRLAGMWLAGPLFLAGTLRLGRVRVFCWSALVGLLAAASGGARTPPAVLAGLELPGLYRLEGAVRSAEPPREGWVRFVLRLEAFVDGGPVAAPCFVRLSWRRGDEPLTSGTRVRCLARIDRIRPAPGTSFDRRRYWARRGVHLEGRVPPRALEVVAPAGPLAARLAMLRRRANATFDRWLTARDAGLARALVTGDRSALVAADRQLVRDTGQAHLLALSGLHVGLLLAGVLAVLRRLGLGVRTASACGIVLLGAYVPFVGAPPSAVRAGLAATLWMGARLLGRRPSAAAVLSAVVVFAFVTEPRTLLDPGFELSLAAVTGILLLGPPLRARLVFERPRLPGLPPPPRARIRRSLAVALGAWAGSAPLVLAWMERVCLLGAPLSLLALPFVALLVAAGFVLGLTAEVPLLASACATAFALAADGLRAVLGPVAESGLGSAEAQAPGVLWYVLYAAAVVWTIRTRRTALGFATVVGLLAAAVASGPPASARLYDAPPLMPSSSLALLPAPLDPTALALLAGVLLVFAAANVRPLGWLTAGGAAAAWILGVAAGWQLGWPGFVALIATFLVTTLASKLPGRHRSGARALRQVAANGLPAFLGCVLLAIGQPEIGTAFFLGGLAALGADTVGSELGVRYGGVPKRFGSGEAMRPGDSGGVTRLGLVASVGGAGIAPVAYGIAVADLGPWVGAVAASGIVASLFDSLLGATLQYRGRDPATNEIVEARTIDGTETKHESGLAWLDNDAVNLCSGLAGALVAWGLLGLL